MHDVADLLCGVSVYLYATFANIRTHCIYLHCTFYSIDMQASLVFCTFSTDAGGKDRRAKEQPMPLYGVGLSLGRNINSWRQSWGYDVYPANHD